MSEIKSCGSKKKKAIFKSAFTENAMGHVENLPAPLRMLREEKGVSQQQLALKLGLAKTHIARLESRAIASLSIEDLDRICHGLEHRLEDVIYRFYTAVKRPGLERSKLDAPTYTIHYADGVQICALVKTGKSYFVGVLRIQPHKEWHKEKVITHKEVFIHILQGNLLLKMNNKEHFFKEGENLTLSKPFNYEIYNPHQLKELVAMIYIAEHLFELNADLPIS